MTDQHNTKLISNVELLQANDNELIATIQEMLVDYARLLVKDSINNDNKVSSEACLTQVNLAFEMRDLLSNLKKEDHEETERAE